MTYLTPFEVKEVVHLSGAQIRLFLGNADVHALTGEVKDAVLQFHQNPGDFTDQALLEKGANVDEAHRHAVRIELRGENPQGAAQVVAKGIWGIERELAVQVFRKELARLSHSMLVRTAGSSSFEFNRLGVDKGLPIRFLKMCWFDVLDQMAYKSGNGIDSRKSNIVIMADGDGTVYDGPKLTHLPFLKDSPVFNPLMDCVRAGAVFMLISGNDLNRTFKRLIDGVPSELYSRILIAANGGADLVCVNSLGKPIFIKNYRDKSLAMTAKEHQSCALDMVYIGDDDSPNGNDRPAFQAVGEARSVVVKNLNDTKLFLEKWMHERKIGLT